MLTPSSRDLDLPGPSGGKPGLPRRRGFRAIAGGLPRRLPMKRRHLTGRANGCGAAGEVFAVHTVHVAEVRPTAGGAAAEKYAQEISTDPGVLPAEVPNGATSPAG